VNSILVTATVQAKSDWKMFLGKPKVPGNYKTDEAKEKYCREWYEAAEKSVAEHPQCLTIGDCLVEVTGLNPGRVNGAASLLKQLSSAIMSTSDRNAGMRVSVSGLDLRMVLKVAALECLKEETVPYWALIYEHPRARFIDPLYSIVLNYSTKLSDEKAMEMAGLGGLSYSTPIEKRHEALKALVTKFMLD
jgi:hypothetical protein